MALVLALLPAVVGLGQSQPESADALLIEQQLDNTKSVTIPVGSRVRVRTTDHRISTGELTAVYDSSYSIGTKEIEMSETASIKFTKGEGSRIGGIAGVVVGIVCFFFGLGLSFLGKYAIDNAGGGWDGCGEALGGVMLLILGIAVGVMGLIFFIVGIAAYSVGKAVGRGFRMGEKWRIRKR